MRFNVDATEAMHIDSSGHVKISNGNLQIERSGSSPLLQFTDTGVNSRWMGLVDGTSNFTIYGTNGSTQELTLDSSGNLLVGGTTYSQNSSEKLSVFGRTGIEANGSVVLGLDRQTSNGDILQFRKDNATVGVIGTDATYGELYISGAGNRGGLGFYDIGFSGIQPVNSDGSLSNGDTNLGYTNSRFKDLYLSGSIANPSGDLTVDASGDIILDSGGYDVRLKVGGTEYAKFSNYQNNFYLEPIAQDKDLIIRGNDGGSVITALTLDMSDAGTATFNHDIKLPDNGKAIFGAGSDLEIYHSGGSSQIRDVGTGNLQISANSAIEFFKAGTSEVLAKLNADSDVELYHDNAKKFETTSTGASVTGSLAVSDASTTRTNLDVDQAGSALAFAIALG